MFGVFVVTVVVVVTLQPSFFLDLSCFGDFHLFCFEVVCICWFVIVGAVLVVVPVVVVLVAAVAVVVILVVVLVIVIAVPLVVVVVAVGYCEYFDHSFVDKVLNQTIVVGWVSLVSLVTVVPDWFCFI